MAKPLRLLLVDNDTLSRRCLSDRLNHDPSLQVVGQAAAAPEALTAAHSLQPDVVVIDPAMPDGGPGLVARLCREAPSSVVLVLTVTEDDRDARQLLRAGARSYLQKNCELSDLDDIAQAIKRVHAGELVVTAMAADAVLKELRGESARAPGEDGLTEREHEVVRLAADGYTNAQIARALSITEHTVKGHVAKILRKLGLDNRVQLTAYAIAHDLVPGTAARWEADGPRV